MKMLRKIKVSTSKNISLSSETEKYTAEKFYKTGREYYTQVRAYESSLPERGEFIKFNLASKAFFTALVLGYAKAPVYLYCLLTERVSDAEQDIIELIYEAAVQLIPQKCKGKGIKNKPAASYSIKVIANQLVILIKQAQEEISNKEIEPNQINEQIQKFSDIELPSGKLLVDYFNINHDQPTSTTSLDELSSSSHCIELALIAGKGTSHQPDTSSKELLGEGCSHD